MVERGADPLQRHSDPGRVKGLYHIKENGGGDPLIKVLYLLQEC